MNSQSLWTQIIVGVLIAATGGLISMLLYDQIKSMDSSHTNQTNISALVPPQSQVRAQILPGMVLIPKGCFQMGSNDGESDEKPVHQVCLDAFYIGKTEVTVAEYAACVRAGKCSTEGLNSYDTCNYDVSGRENHPMNCVDWDQAREYCEWKGGRLPTEAEWEYVARGTDGRTYPWGNQTATCRYAVMDDGGLGCGRNGTWPVGSKPDGKSPFGVLDMAGNVWEWISDWYGTYFSGSIDNPHGSPTGSYRVLRGGSWYNLASSLRSAFRNRFAPALRFPDVGFRLFVPLGQ